MPAEVVLKGAVGLKGKMTSVDLRKPKAAVLVVSILGFDGLGRVEEGLLEEGIEPSVE